MTYRLAVANQKGGVAKTTTAVNLSASLAYRGFSVLLIDLDPQGNATVGSGVNPKQLPHTINEWLLDKATWSEVCTRTPGRYDLLPSTTRLTQAEVHLLQQEERQFCLKKHCEPHLSAYDFVIVDCPPSLNTLTINALMMAQAVMIPMQCEYYALEGIAGLLTTIEQLRRSGHPHLHIHGVLRTMYDGRNRLAQEVSAQLQGHFGERLYQTIIPRNVRVAEAPSHGLPVLSYEPKSLGAQAYLACADELLQRVGLSSAAVEQNQPRVEAEEE